MQYGKRITDSGTDPASNVSGGDFNNISKSSLIRALPL